MTQCDSALYKRLTPCDTCIYSAKTLSGYEQVMKLRRLHNQPCYDCGSQYINHKTKRTALK